MRPRIGFFLLMLAVLIVIQPALVNASPRSELKEGGPFIVHLPAVLKEYVNPYVPVLLAPAYGASLQTLSPIISYRVSVKPPDANIAQLYISTDPNPGPSTMIGWSATVSTPGTYTTQMSFNLAANTIYYWRVVWINASSEELYSSQINFFITGSGMGLPGNTTLLAPPSGSDMTGPFTMSWNAYPDALRYMVWFQSEVNPGYLCGFFSTDATPELQISTSTNWCFHEDEQYEWYVVVLNAFGWSTTPSEHWQIRH